MAIVSTDSTYTFTVTGNRSLTAVFEPLAPHYTITVIVDPSAAGTVSGGGYYESGKAVTLTYTAAENYSFTGWYNASGALISTANPYSFTATADASITAKATYIPVYVITAIIDPAEAGTVAGTGSYQEGAAVTLTATVNDGYKFTGWKENGAVVSTDNPYTFTAQADKAFTATFEEHTSRLPAGYTEIEYLHSSGNVGFNTGVTVNFKTSKILLDIMIESAPSGYSNVINSANDPTNGRLNCFLLNNTNSVWFGFDGGNNTSVSKPLANQRLTIDWSFPDKTFKVGSTTKSFSGTTVTNGGTIIILNNSGAAPTCKLYSFKIYNSSTLIKDYVPFVDSTGKIGLYDLVGDTPIYDINTGSGTLTAGPAV